MKKKILGQERIPRGHFPSSGKISINAFITNFPCQIVLIIKDWFQLLYNKGSPGLCSVMGEMEGVREAQKEGYICISIADSHCCIAENNKTM